MTVRNQNQTNEPSLDVTAPQDHRTLQARKPFVQPAISNPIDVLAATSFFQVVDSGGTGFRRRSPGRTD